MSYATDKDTAQRQSSAGISEILRALFGSRETGIIVALLLTILAFALLDWSFLSVQNLITIVLQASVTAILAIGETFVIITAGIDLSVGSMLAVTAVVSAKMAAAGLPFAVVIVLTLLAGLAIGLVNGLIITLSKITPFVVTLGTMSIFSGVALIISGGQTVYGIPSGFSDLLAGGVGPLPVPVIIAVAVMVVGTFVLRQTKLGEYSIAIGGNQEVTRLAGINVVAYTTAVYAICGLLAALAGMITAARLGAADPVLGKDLLLSAIAASVMGGANLMGGEGSMIGAVAGAILISTLQAGLTFLNVQAFYQEVAVGAVIILALLLNRLPMRRK